MSDIKLKIACPQCGFTDSYSKHISTCPQCSNGFLDAIYLLDEKLNWPTTLQGRPNSMWRYRELLPIVDDHNIVSMGEGMTPLLRSENLAAMLGLKNLYFKDERQGPTGSFKDRQASLAISSLKEMGVNEAVVASTGNVAIAYSAYASRAHVKLWAFIISSIPSDKMREIALYGSEIVKVTGTYNQTKQVASHFAKDRSLFYDMGLKNIAAKEAMKTLAFEIAEQLGDILGPDDAGHPWRVPDWYIQSVSGGLGPAGVMKAFGESESHGLTSGMPKLGMIQAAGCDPMTRAFLADEEEAAPIIAPTTRIATLATDVPGAAYKMIRKDIKQYGGAFASVTDEEAYRALKTLARLEGISVEPATAVAFAGLFSLVRQRLIKSDEVVVVVISGHTFPVEKHMLSEDLIHEMDVTPLSRTSIPQEGLLAALETVDERVSHVLIVEDDQGASDLMERILRANNIKTINKAMNGREGLQQARENKPDLVVLDLMMPEMDGFAVLDAMKADHNLRDIPVIIATAKELTKYERELLAGKAQALLQKGALIDDTAIRNLLDNI